MIYLGPDESLITGLSTISCHVVALVGAIYSHANAQQPVPVDLCLFVDLSQKSLCCKGGIMAVLKRNKDVDDVMGG